MRQKEHDFRLGPESSLERNKAMSSAMRKRDFNIGLMPKEKAELNWEKGGVNINWSKQSIVIDWDGDFMPQISVDAKFPVDISLLRRHDINITVEPLATGRYINQAI